MQFGRFVRGTPRRLAFLLRTPLRQLAILLKFGPGPLVARLIDRADERLARRRRESFGRRHWLLSWQRESDGRWKARLSGPETVHTVERTATTRSRAIDRSARALTRLGTIRDRLDAGPTPDSPIGRAL